MTEYNILLAFILTAIAGLSTGIGSLIALIAKHTNTKFLLTVDCYLISIPLYLGS
jgi:ZIP family zinc transporter